MKDDTIGYFYLQEEDPWSELHLRIFKSLDTSRHTSTCSSCAPGPLHVETTATLVPPATSWRCPQVYWFFLGQLVDPIRSLLHMWGMPCGG